jgi:hypothetical protein
VIPHVTESRDPAVKTQDDANYTQFRGGAERNPKDLMEIAREYGVDEKVVLELVNEGQHFQELFPPSQDGC